MIELIWEQVAAWRLARQHLLERAPAENALVVVRDLHALHAQVFSAAQLSLHARVNDLPPDFLENALWTQKTLLKTWLMRGTLHLVTAADYPLFVAALRAFDHFRKNSWLKYHGVTIEELEAIIAAVPAILTETGITREELADALAAETGNPQLKERLLSGWGALLKPAAFRGALCFAPNQGQNVTFARPDAWLGAEVATNLSPDEAFQEILYRYLTAFGPATPEDFARWWGLQPAPAKRIFKAAGDSLVKVNVEGWESYLPAAAPEQLAALPVPEGVRLLPLFDPYVVALPRDNDYFLPAVHKARVYRRQGWISPVVLHQGRIIGVWEEGKSGQSALTATCWETPTDAVRAGIAAEAQRLAQFRQSESPPMVTVTVG